MPEKERRAFRACVPGWTGIDSGHPKSLASLLPVSRDSQRFVADRHQYGQGPFFEPKGAVMGKPRVHHPMPVAALVAFVLAAAAPLAFAAPAPEDPIAETALKQIQALEAQKLERTRAQTKMDSQLIYALHRSALKLAAPEVEPNLRIQDDGRVLVDITAVFTDDPASSAGSDSVSSPAPATRRPQPLPG